MVHRARGGCPARGERQLRGAALSGGGDHRWASGRRHRADEQGLAAPSRRGGADRAGANAARVVVGYDLTFSPPKSVSVLWAGADDATRAEVLVALDEAVAAGLRYADRHALVVRGRGGTAGGARPLRRGLPPHDLPGARTTAAPPRRRRELREGRRRRGSGARRSDALPPREDDGLRRRGRAAPPAHRSPRGHLGSGPQWRRGDRRRAGRDAPRR